jgi:hypothetical protein
MVYSPRAVLKHLQTYIPRLTNLFTNEQSVSAVIVAGSPQILRITYPSHGKIAGQEINTINGLLDNGIASVTQPEAGILRIVVNVPHDLTLGFEDNLTDETKVELQGFTDSQFNGFFVLDSVISSTIFEIQHPNTPTLNGNEVLRENRSYGVNGAFEISAVPDVDTFDIELTGRPEFDIKSVYGLVVVNGYRMDYVADWDRAQQKYTKQLADNLWLFIIMENVIASKDRNIESDANQTKTAQNEQRIKNVGEFSINVSIPTKEDIGAGNAVQLAYEIVYPIILKVMAGVPLETFGNSNYVTTLISHGAVLYNNAYYAHNFTFEYVYETISEDTFINNFFESVAFRRINISFAEKQDGSFLLLD